MRRDNQGSFRLRRIAVPAIGAVGLLIVPGLVLSGGPARAQLLNQLKNSVGSGQGSGGGALGGLGGGVPSVSQASPTNLAGVLQYCVRNNYLSGGAASSVKDSLLGKATGSSATGSSSGATDSAFNAGNNGTLQTGQGQGYSLGGGGIKQQVTQKVCGLVLQHAKSML